MRTTIIKQFIGIATISALACFSGCKKDNPTPATTRSYYMGFQNSAPNYTNFDTFLQALALWVPTSDAAIVSLEVPWDSLLAGVDPKQYVTNNYSGLVAFYRQNNLKVWVYIDPENGLDRTGDSQGLVAAHRSIAQPDIQKIYRRFVVVMDSMLLPEHLGLALETNLIRLAAPDSIYQGVVNATKAAAVDVSANNKSKKLSVSVQAEIAWGKLTGNGDYIGIETDYTDFPFIQELGISSYPYFVFTSPSELPVNYYTKLASGHSTPVFVSEGGWSSNTFTTTDGIAINSSQQIQQAYITRQSQMLSDASAIGWFQLTFTDIDLSTVPSSVDPSIANFAYLGMVDKNLASKPAFDTWKEIFKLTNRQ